MVIKDNKTDTLKDRLDKVILDAMNIPERIAQLDKVNPLHESSLNQKALDEWREVLGCTNESQFDDLLDLIGWPKEDLSYVLTHKPVKTNYDLKWERDLRNVFSNLEEFCNMVPSDLTDDNQKNIYNIVLPFIKMAEAFVIKKSDTIGLKITYNSGAKIVSILSNRMITLCMNILDSEIYLSSILNSIRATGKDDRLWSMESWISRIERYPVLGRMIATAYVNWKTTTTEFMQRLYDDQDFISNHFFNGESLGYLTDFTGDAGDVHCGGRSVALLTFSGEKRLVYKPKNLELANNSFQLINFLNPYLSIKLSTRKIAVRGDYTWEEFITFKECKSKSEFPAFYRRLGMHTRLLQLLGARDFWLDNLIAHGDQPSFIDLEMIIQHLKDEETGLLPSEIAAIEKLEETAAKIGIVSFPTPIGMGEKAEDLGVLAPIKPFSSPFKLDLSSGDQMGIDTNKTDSGYIVWNKADYVPCFNGEFANPEFYMDDFLEGYKEMNTVLINKKKELLNPESCIFNLKKSLLRYIHRDTWTYMHIITRTSHSQSIVNGISKDKALYSLFREVWKDGKLNNHKAKVLLDEIEHMSDQDVPLFNSEGGSSSLQVADYEIDNYFSHTALDKIIERLENIDDFDISFNKEILLSCFATGNHNPPQKEKATQLLTSSKEVSSIDWGHYAMQTADFIASKAIVGENGDLAWIGMDFIANIDNYYLEALKPDILSGTCGLGMLFADMYHEFNDKKYKNLSNGSLQSSLSIVKSSETNFSLLARIWESSDKPLHLGAYFGIGSQILALRHCAYRLNSKELEEACNVYVNAIPIKAIRNYSNDDFMSGYTGLLFSMPQYVIDQSNSNLLDYVFTKPTGLPPNSELLNRLPSFNKGVEYYSLLQNPTSPEIKSPTTTGEYFTLLESIGNQDQKMKVDQIMKAKLDKIDHHYTTTELLENSDLSLCMFDIYGDAWYLEKAKTYASEIINRYEKSGKWFNDIWEADAHNLSVLFGMGALSHLFLRLKNPGTYGSFRKLKTFKN